MEEGKLELESAGIYKFDGETKVFANMFIVRDFDPEKVQVNPQVEEVDQVDYWSLEKCLQKAELPDEERVVKADSIAVFKHILDKGILFNN